MKLTKGKISRIQNKKKQSLKRYKKGGKTHKSKTFRKRRAFNLHNKSLKKYKGGQPVETEAKSDETSILAENPTSDVVGETPPTVVPTSDVEEPVKTDASPVDGEEPLGSSVSQAVGEEEPVKTDVSPAVGEEQDPGEGPGSGTALPPPVSAEGSPDSVNLSNNVDDVAGSAGSEVTGTDATSATPAVGTEKVEEGEQEQEGEQQQEGEQEQEEEQKNQPSMIQNAPMGNDISIVAESLDKLADYISEKIAQKLKNSSFGTSSGSGSGSGSGLNRDSFNAVANANETLAESA